MKIDLSSFKKIRIHPTLTQVWLCALGCALLMVCVLALVAGLMFVQVSDADATANPTVNPAVMVSHARVDAVLDVLMRRAETFERLRTTSTGLPDVTR